MLNAEVADAIVLREVGGGVSDALDVVPSMAAVGALAQPESIATAMTALKSR